MNAAPTTGRRVPWSLVIIAAGGLGGLAIGYALAASNDAASPRSAALGLGVFGLLAALLLVGSWASSRPFALRRRVPIAAEDIRAHAGRWFGRPPWVLARDDPHQLVVWRRTEPILGLVVVLLLLGVIPGILYYLWARGTQTVAVGVAPAPGGADLEIVVHPQGSDGRNRAVDFFNSLHRLVGGDQPPRP